MRDYREVGTAADRRRSGLAPLRVYSLHLSLSFYPSLLPVFLLSTLSLLRSSLSPSRGRLGYSRYLRRVRVRERFYVGSVAMRDLGRKLADGAASRVSTYDLLRFRGPALRKLKESTREQPGASSTSPPSPVYSRRLASLVRRFARIIVA